MSGFLPSEGGKRQEGVASFKGAQGREGLWATFPSLPFLLGDRYSNDGGGGIVRARRYGKQETGHEGRADNG